MNHHFKVVSLSHQKAPVHVREAVALNDNEKVQLMQLLHEVSHTSDCLILSTCNRTEVYYANETCLKEQIIKLIGIVKGINNPMQYEEYFNSIDNECETVYYLYRVSMGLEAKVLGDIQISNQIKKAYQLSADSDFAGPYLHRLMHAIFYCNKRVSLETEFRDGAASVSYATVELITELTDYLNIPHILLLGVGEMGGDVARNLMGTNVKVIIANRTESKAKALAEECGFDYVPFSEWENHLQESDVVVSSVSVEEPIITLDKVKNLDIVMHKYFIDMCVPRSIAENITDKKGIESYNIDTIQSKTAKTVSKRKASIPKVEGIIHESLKDFLTWSKELEVSPTIHKLKQALEDIRKDEINRYTKNLDTKNTEAVDLITKGIMQKIIKLPVLQLKAACKRGEADTLIDVLNELFNLEAVEETAK